ncbi:glycosyltransferase family 4 protein [Methanotorris formicicus]|uniref:Glycosyl transferase group 1 n=1 Tax=Methanotorris formicicus Mc-S-70 TaxID=647171 RepID=H1KX22_9EURY|nr:glycosyltransferase family 4 protein [Methanotorris formicicus]EHP88547.1 glycosyl transferase group 1 [Methanotorris formicicus Mc-S-70]
MKKMCLITWYFPSFPGGAEKSILYELKEYEKKGYHIFVICFDEFYPKGDFIIDGIKGKNYGLRVSLSKYSRFYTLILNREYVLSTLEKHKEELKESIAITQNLMTPIITEFCIKNNIKYIYYLRDELNLNEFRNYEVGLRKVLKIFKSIIEFPAIYYYMSKNEVALRNAYKIISNSKYIQQLLKRKFNLDSEVKYPKIDHSKLDRTKIKKENQKYIAFIGGENSMKGHDIVLKIAKKLKNEEFLIVGPYKKPFKKENILFVPYQKDVMEIYKVSKLILVPSRWNEAFGRVVLEANYLGIPAITSNRGGLPEANKNKDYIVNDLENIDEWVEKIEYALNSDIFLKED